MTFKDRLKAAAEWAVLFAVKYGIVFAAFVYLVLTLFGDYAVTRQRALHGQEIWELVQQQKAAQQAQKPDAAK
jgi:hypothetical protein